MGKDQEALTGVSSSWFYPSRFEPAFSVSIVEFVYANPRYNSEVLFIAVDLLLQTVWTLAFLIFPPKFFYILFFII